MPDSQDDAVAKTLARYRQLCTEVARVQARQRELMSQINDCFAAARVFEFDLTAEVQREVAGDPRQPLLCPPDPVAPELFPLPGAHASVGAVSIKSLVLNAVEKAHPAPVHAADIRRDLVSRGYTIHEKTVGMTLYRWSLNGCVRRAGRDWYFVPPGQRGTKVNGHRYGPEPAPAPVDAHVA